MKTPSKSPPSGNYEFYAGENANSHDYKTRTKVLIFCFCNNPRVKIRFRNIPKSPGRTHVLNKNGYPGGDTCRTPRKKRFYAEFISIFRSRCSSRKRERAILRGVSHQKWTGAPSSHPFGPGFISISGSRNQFYSGFLIKK